MPAAADPQAQTFRDYLDAQTGVDDGLKTVVLAVARACIEISGLVARGALANVLGAAGGAQNVQGEDQKKLDVISNDILITAADICGQVAAIASEEEDDILAFTDRDKRGPYLLLFDPLDGSSNIDVNVSIGTIFSILPAPEGEVTAKDFLQPGRRQIASGYALYGPQTTLVLTLSDGVAAFTLDPLSREWLQTGDGLAIAPSAKEFAINMSNRRHWAPPVTGYIEDCLAGKEGPRGKDFNMRWVASMVADVHRILNRGGVFLYPWDKREPDRAGKLRLLYEANPLGLIVERAGGAITNAYAPMLDVQPKTLHQRVSVVLGAKEEVDRITAAHVAFGPPPV
jgi:fructose-1,6-bisphosphatase I